MDDRRMPNTHYAVLTALSAAAALPLRPRRARQVPPHTGRTVRLRPARPGPQTIKPRRSCAKSCAKQPDLNAFFRILPFGLFLPETRGNKGFQAFLAFPA